MRTRRPRPAPATRSAFAGFRLPPDVIVVAVRWHLRFGLSYRDVEELLAEHGVEVDHVTVYRWVQRAIATMKVTPVEVVTDRAATSPMVLQELLPAAWHRTERYANNRVEADHGQLKARLRPMRGLKQDASARVIIVGHAFVQSFRRGTTSWPPRSQ
jgi:transposase-like protein